MQTRFDRPLNLLLFGGFAVIAASRFFTSVLSARRVGPVLGLLLLAFLCYVYARGGQARRVLAILVYLVGWFRSPAWGLLCLFLVWVFGAYRQAAERVRREREEKETTWASEQVRVESEDSMSEGGDMARMLFTMRVASEAEGKIRAFGAPFASPYGDGVVPLLMATERGERGIYVEPGPWDSEKEEACLRWLAALRTSDREDLDVEIRSDVETPERLRFYTGRTPRVIFELVGLLHVRVFEQLAFGKENAMTLGRLAKEYLDVDLQDGIEGLETLDRLVVDLLRPAGHILPSTVLLLGSYFGEALITLYRGRWSVRGATTEDIGVEMLSSAGTISANVFGKVQKLFANGIEDATAWMARSIGERFGSDSQRD